MRKQLESVFVKYFGREGSKRLVSYLELVCRKPGRADSSQCTPWRNFAPFTTSADIQARAQAWGAAGDRQWVRNI
jgi:hypothetical protein